MSRTQKLTLALAFVLVLLDAACIGFSYYGAMFLLRPSASSFADRLWGHLPYLALILVVWFGSAIHQRLYLPRRGDDLVPLLCAVTKAVLTTIMVTVFIAAVFTRAYVDREAILLIGLGMLVSLLLYRSLIRLSLWGLRLRGFNTQNILLVGANETTTRIVDTIRAHGQYGYHVEGFIEDDPERAARLSQYGIPHLGGLADLEHILISRVIDGVYVALPLRSFYESIVRMAHMCEGLGTPVRWVADRLPLGDASSDIWRLEDVPLLSLGSVQDIRSHGATQRVTDFVISSLLLLVLSPLFVLLSLLIRFDSKGPIFVHHLRKRRSDGRNFPLCSFRCTVDGIDVGNPQGNPIRFTRIGRHLHRYNLDELPHLFNVWRGEISLIEPKPPIPLGEFENGTCISEAAPGIRIPATASQSVSVPQSYLNRITGQGKL